VNRLVRSALLAGAAAFVGFAPVGAGAADAVDSGWWWKPQSGQLATLPPPPGIPEGGLFVQGAPDGASAIAAARFELTDAETAPVLQLRLAEGSQESASAAVVLACPATTPWSTGGAQAWDQKPVPDCARQAIGVVAEDGSSVAFDLSSFAVGPTVDVVILPGQVEELPDGVNGSSFTLVFERPEDGDMVTQAAGSPITAPPSTAARPAGSGSVASPAASGSRPAPVPSFQPPAAPVAPALPADEVAAPPVQAPSTPVPTFSPAEAPDVSDARTLAVVLLLGAALATVLAGRRDALLGLLGRAPAAAVAGAPLQVSGLGRFARERTGPPPTLR